MNKIYNQQPPARHILRMSVLVLTLLPAMLILLPFMLPERPVAYAASGALTTESWLQTIDTLNEKCLKNGFHYDGSCSTSTYSAALSGARKTNCAKFLMWALNLAEIDGKPLLPADKTKIYTSYGHLRGEDSSYIRAQSGKFRLLYVSGSVPSLVSSGKLKEGDIIGYKNRLHTECYIGKKGDRYRFLNYGPDFRSRRGYSTRSAGTLRDSRYTIGIIIRIRALSLETGEVTDGQEEIEAPGLGTETETSEDSESESDAEEEASSAHISEGLHASEEDIREAVSEEETKVLETVEIPMFTERLGEFSSKEIMYPAAERTNVLLEENEGEGETETAEEAGDMAAENNPSEEGGDAEDASDETSWMTETAEDSSESIQAEPETTKPGKARITAGRKAGDAPEEKPAAKVEKGEDPAEQVSNVKQTDIPDTGDHEPLLQYGLLLTVSVLLLIGLRLSRC